MDVRHRWFPRVVGGATLVFAFGLLFSLWAWTCSQVSLALASPSGEGQASSPGPLDLQVNVFSGNLSYNQTDLPFPCANCTLSLDVYLICNSQDTQIGDMMRLHGCQLPHDLNCALRITRIRPVSQRLAQSGL